MLAWLYLQILISVSQSVYYGEVKISIFISTILGNFPASFVTTEKTPI